MMKEGLLIFDNTPNRSLKKKVALAAVRHRRKTGKLPNACYVHPSALNGKEELWVGTVCVQPRRETQPDNFWIGREETDGG
jgi:hypothetical protein